MKSVIAVHPGHLDILDTPVPKVGPFVHQWPTRRFEKKAQPQLCEWIRTGKLTSADFITHRFPLDRIREAFDEVARRKVIKALIEYPIF